MGIYIYSIRTSNLTARINGELTKVYACNFLARSGGGDWDNHESAYNRRLMGAAEATWERRGGLPAGTLIYMAGDNDTPREFDTVVRYAGKGPCHYDCDNFGEVVGFLRKGREGRKTVWTVEPMVWEVTFTLPNSVVWDGNTRRSFFSVAEATEHVRTVRALLANPSLRKFRIEAHMCSALGALVKTLTDHIKVRLQAAGGGSVVAAGVTVSDAHGAKAVASLMVEGRTDPAATAVELDRALENGHDVAALMALRAA